MFQIQIMMKTISNFLFEINQKFQINDDLNLNEYLIANSNSISMNFNLLQVLAVIT
jgi:hypothetical protein